MTLARVVCGELVSLRFFMDQKLSHENRDEVNTLIERAQDDLEGVIFELVGQREQMMSLMRRALRYGLNDSEIYDAQEACAVAREMRAVLANIQGEPRGSNQSKT